MIIIQIFCEKCHRSMSEDNFYMSNNLEKYPNNGKMNVCKKCLTMHVNNWDPETFLPILQDLDVPYIEGEWKKIIDAYCKDPKKVTGTTVLGRYLVKMRLRQWKDLRWKDTAKIKEKNDKDRIEFLRKQGNSEEEIQRMLSENNLGEMPAEFKVVRIEEQKEEQKRKLVRERAEAKLLADSQGTSIPDISIPVANESLPIVTLPDYSEVEQEIARPEDDLTMDEKKMLLLKWGNSYSPQEWIQLEQLYTAVTQSFDIQTPTHIDYLKLICKTSLKCNQLIDSGDIEGFQKMSRVYDNLMKSAKFTAAQNKAEQGEYVDSVGELVALAEASGDIKKYYVDTPKDKVDETLDDMKKYLFRLVTEEQGLGNLIENAVLQLQQEDKKNEVDDDEDEVEETLSDLDFENFNDFLEEEEAKDYGSE